MRARHVLQLSVLACLGCAPPNVAPAVRSARFPEYSLAVRIQPEARRIDVSGTVRLPAVDSARKELRIGLSERMDSLQVEVIAPAGLGATMLERDTAGLGAARVEGESRDAHWILRARNAIPKGEPVTLRFSYRGSGDTTFLYYIGPEVAFASGWGDSWYPDINGSSKATGDLTIQLPTSWKAIAGNPPVGDAQPPTPGTFRFVQHLPTYFTFAAGPYTVVTRAGTVPISAWLLKPRDGIDLYLAGVEKMVNVLAQEFGSYAFGALSLVEVPRPIAKAAGFNAFSPASFLVLNHRTFDVPDVKYSHQWLGHELSHQWFPHAVIWDKPGFLYMEEALAEYGGLRIVEVLDGPDAARRSRTTGYEYDPIYSASAYFRLVGAGVDEPLATIGAGINQRNLAYNKGSLFFDMFGREIGRANMQRILNDLTRGKRLATTTWPQFLEAARTVSGRNLDWFFEQWLGRAGAPDFRLAWTQRGDSVGGTISQPSPYYRAHLTVELRGAEGQKLSRVVEIVGATATFSVAPGFRVTDVILDPEYEVLRWTPEFHAMADSARAAVQRRP
jgi:peptidase M1-like protein